MFDYSYKYCSMRLNFTHIFRASRSQLNFEPQSNDNISNGGFLPWTPIYQFHQQILVYLPGKIFRKQNLEIRRIG